MQGAATAGVTARGPYSLLGTSEAAVLPPAPQGGAQSWI